MRETSLQDLEEARQDSRLAEVISHFSTDPGSRMVPVLRSSGARTVWRTSSAVTGSSPALRTVRHRIGVTASTSSSSAGQSPAW